jgi:hypothetical protein
MEGSALKPGKIGFRTDGMLYGLRKIVDADGK